MPYSHPPTQTKLHSFHKGFNTLLTVAHGDGGQRTASVVLALCLELKVIVPPPILADALQVWGIQSSLV